MKLKKAIKVNEDNIKFFEDDGYQECADAVKLGNEALKAIIRARQGDPPLYGQLLPGETEE